MRRNREEAIREMSSIQGMPLSCGFRNKRKAIDASSAKQTMPSASEQAEASAHVSPGFALPQLVAEIRELYRWRQDLLRTEVGLTNRANAICRRLVDFNPFAKDEKERKSKLRGAQTLFASFAKKGTPSHPLTEQARLICLPILSARAFVEAERKRPQQKIEELVKELPVWAWWSSINGLGALGLGIIVGEAGDLSAYANPAKLWKRMGVGIVGGPKGPEAQRKKTNPEEAILHGYNPSRRAALWNVGDALIKKQNPYRDLYLERKEYEALQDPGRSKMHNHRRAQRYMEKRLLRDLWRAWRLPRL